MVQEEGSGVGGVLGVLSGGMRLDTDTQLNVLFWPCVLLTGMLLGWYNAFSNNPPF